MKSMNSDGLENWRTGRRVPGLGLVGRMQLPLLVTGLLEEEEEEEEQAGSDLASWQGELPKSAESGEGLAPRILHTWSGQSEEGGERMNPRFSATPTTRVHDVFLTSADREMREPCNRTSGPPK